MKWVWNWCFVLNNLYGFLKILSEFEERLILLGLRGVFGGIVVIFGGVEMGEMLDFSGFCRSGYRTRKR